MISTQQSLRPQAVGTSRFRNSLHCMAEENELTQKQTLCRKLPNGSSLEHVGFFTIWNASLHSDLSQKSPLSWEGTGLKLALFSRFWCCTQVYKLCYTLSPKSMHPESLRTWKICQWHLSNFLCANLSNKIHSDPWGHCWLVQTPSETKPHLWYLLSMHQSLPDQKMGRCPETPHLMQKSSLF